MTEDLDISNIRAQEIAKKTNNIEQLKRMGLM